MPQALLDLLDLPTVQAAVVLLGSFVAAFFVELLFRGVILRVTRSTQTQLDDQIVAVLQRPIFLSVILYGLTWSVDMMSTEERISFLTDAFLATVAVVIWTGACFRLSSLVLRHFSRQAREGAFLQPRTLPLFDMLANLVIIGAATYFALVAWSIDVTGWLASAGIVGLAVGFAAKDSLANLFAGIFIIADAPYKIGDMIKFEDGLRGRVTDIGLRSTRILTRDNIEINIPNSIIGNSKVVNESAGPHEKERVPIKVSVAYGSDIDLVRQILLDCPKGQPHICEDPAPSVFFVNFGASGLDFWLMVWIHEPYFWEEVVDNLNGRVYNAFNAAGIEIPYSKHDVYIKGLPEPPRGLVQQVAAPPAARALGPSQGLSTPPG